MKILLDTNILIHREGRRLLRDDIGVLFRWVDKIKAEKCVHPDSVTEIRKYKDLDVVNSFEAKLKSYVLLGSRSTDTPEIRGLRLSDKTDNDFVDTTLINEVHSGRVDLLLSEDKEIHKKAQALGIAEKVLRIDEFLEQALRSHPDLVDYQVLSVKKEFFRDVNVSDSFFDSFRHDYPGFNRWFNRKADDSAYVCRGDDNSIMAFLYIKVEDHSELYADISPPFAPMRRLKIGTFKVVQNGYRIGERFLKIVFDNALGQRVNEIYLTIFNRTPEYKRLTDLIRAWGFSYHGIKTSEHGKEDVWIRLFNREAKRDNPASCYPFISRTARKFIVPIYPEYHTELLPDSILSTESPANFEEHRPNRNGIRKAYISRSFRRDLVSGDIIVFYRTGSGTAPAHYSAVATTIGVVESIQLNLPDFESFKKACASVSVFNDDKLLEHWNYKPRSRPFVVQFLSVYTFPRRPNLMELKENRIIEEAPRGFELLGAQAFERLLEIANAKDCPIVD